MKPLISAMAVALGKARPARRHCEQRTARSAADDRLAKHPVLKTKRKNRIAFVGSSSLAARAGPVGSSQ